MEVHGRHLGQLFQDLSVVMVADRIRITFVIMNTNQVQWNIIDIINGVQPNEICPVCYNPANSYIIPCNHVICLECTYRLLEIISALCPLCRGPITEVNYIR